MSLEQLWAGWRSRYVVAATEAERATTAGGGVDGRGVDDPAACVFCRIVGSGPASPDNGVVWRDDEVFVVQNAFPYASGHLLVLPVRHEPDLAGLTDRESEGLWRSLRTSVEAVEAAYAPDGVNVGANLGRAAGAGIPRHLHLHVVPRWSGDTNFMTSVAGVRVMPESLDTGWERLRAVWPTG